MITKINGVDLPTKGGWCIFGEESANLSLSGNGYQFSYGNGAVGTIGIPVPIDCVATKLLWQAELFGTSCTIALYKGFTTTNTPSSTGQSISITGVQHGLVQTITPVSFTAGEYPVFRTTAVSGTYNNVRVGVFLEYDLFN